MHSKTASILDITRDEAKIVNYARIYGAAEQFAGRLLTEFDPDVLCVCVWLCVHGVLSVCMCVNMCICVYIHTSVCRVLVCVLVLAWACLCLCARTEACIIRVHMCQLVVCVSVRVCACVSLICSVSRGGGGRGSVCVRTTGARGVYLILEVERG